MAADLGIGAEGQDLPQARLGAAVPAAQRARAGLDFKATSASALSTELRIRKGAQGRPLKAHGAPVQTASPQAMATHNSACPVLLSGPRHGPRIGRTHGLPAAKLELSASTTDVPRTLMGAETCRTQGSCRRSLNQAPRAAPPLSPLRRPGSARTQVSFASP